MVWTGAVRALAFEYSLERVEDRSAVKRPITGESGQSSPP
jgi:hypothetical protein